MQIRHDMAGKTSEHRTLVAGGGWDPLQAGRHKEAIEQLKLADIDVG